MHKSIWVLMLIATLLSCKNEKNTKNNEETFSNEYQETIIPTDINKLWLSEGNMESDTVLIINQGGPRDSLYFEKYGRVMWRYLPNYKDKYVIHLHQSQTYNPSIFKYKNEFTKEMAQKEIENTTEILDRAIKHFKDKGKTVVVIGHSYGTFCVTNYLATRNHLADKYILSAGRIDDNLESVKSKLNGFNGEFDEDGITFKVDKIENESDYTESEIAAYKVRQILKGAIGSPRYSTKLKNKDLSNVVYFYATNDQRVGALTKTEIDFLESKNVRVIETNDGHGDIIKRVIDAVRDGTIK